MTLTYVMYAYIVNMHHTKHRLYVRLFVTRTDNIKLRQRQTE